MCVCDDLGGNETLKEGEQRAAVLIDSWVDNLSTYYLESDELTRTNGIWARPLITIRASVCRFVESIDLASMAGSSNRLSDHLDTICHLNLANMSVEAKPCIRGYTGFSNFGMMTDAFESALARSLYTTANVAYLKRGTNSQHYASQVLS